MIAPLQNGLPQSPIQSVRQCDRAPAYQRNALFLHESAVQAAAHALTGRLGLERNAQRQLLAVSTRRNNGNAAAFVVRCSTHSCRSPFYDRLTGPRRSPVIRWRRMKGERPSKRSSPYAPAEAAIERQLSKYSAANYRPKPAVRVGRKAVVSTPCGGADCNSGHVALGRAGIGDDP